MTKPKSTKPRYTQADYRRRFGKEVCSYFVVESSLHPGELQINQYASRLIGTLTPAQARELAANLIEGANVVEATKYGPDGAPLTNCFACANQHEAARGPGPHELPPMTCTCTCHEGNT